MSTTKCEKAGCEKCEKANCEHPTCKMVHLSMHAAEILNFACMFLDNVHGLMHNMEKSMLEHIILPTGLLDESLQLHKLFHEIAESMQTFKKNMKQMNARMPDHHLPLLGEELGDQVVPDKNNQITLKMPIPKVEGKVFTMPASTAQTLELVEIVEKGVLDILKMDVQVNDIYKAPGDNLLMVNLTLPPDYQQKKAQEEPQEETQEDTPSAPPVLERQDAEIKEEECLIYQTLNGKPRLFTVKEWDVEVKMALAQALEDLKSGTMSSAQWISFIRKVHDWYDHCPMLLWNPRTHLAICQLKKWVFDKKDLVFGTRIYFGNFFSLQNGMIDWDRYLAFKDGLPLAD